MSSQNKFIRTSILFDNQRDHEVVVELNLERRELEGIYKLMDAYSKKLKEMQESNKPQLYFESCEYHNGSFDLVKKIEEVH